jgi:hypothetical protein
MDQSKLHPPFAPETTAEQGATILAQIGVALTTAALRVNQTLGPTDQPTFAIIAGDLFEDLVNVLEVQVKTTDHVALFNDIIEWSALQAKESFPEHPFCSQEIEIRALGRKKRFYEDVAAHFAKREPSQDISARLDEAVHRLDISHEELADRIGISRTTYFEVKAGRGGKRSRGLAETYLSELKRRNRD